MRHIEMAGGERHMEIDHFDPRISGAARQAYSNLNLASRHCNNMKSDEWPTAAEIAAGCRLLNPTLEMDYGKHIFEDPASNHLVGVTIAGRYHIDILDLNHATSVWERKKRAEYRAFKRKSPMTLKGSFIEINELLSMVGTQFDNMIHDIPALPAALESDLELGQRPKIPVSLIE